jgi:hypothetical protein
MLGTKKKRAIDNLDFDIDFSDWLTEGDALESATATADIGVVVGVVEVIGPVVKVWLSGGVAGDSCVITVTVLTTGILGAAKRTKQVGFSLRITDC